MWLGLGWYSRQLEHEADHWACLRLQACGEPSTGVYFRALGKLTEGAKKQGWLHPSFEDRLGFLERAHADAKSVTKFHRRMRMFAWIGSVVTLAGLASILLGI